MHEVVQQGEKISKKIEKRIDMKRWAVVHTFGAAAVGAMKIATYETQLTDAQWKFLQPRLPKTKQRGRPFSGTLISATVAVASSASEVRGCGSVGVLTPFLRVPRGSTRIFPRLGADAEARIADLADHGKTNVFIL